MQQQGVNVTVIVGGIMLEKNYGSIVTIFTYRSVVVF